MTQSERVKIIIERLDKHYPQDGTCFLDFNRSKPYELMIATILSAQTTDLQVNKVTKTLFQKYDTVDKFANSDLNELQKDISSIGLYKNKANHIKNAMILLRDEFNYVLPSEVEQLIKFNGVGRKTANVVRSHIFNLPSIVVDTHVTRISNKLSLVKDEKDAVKIEFKLMKILPKSSWLDFNQQVISFGRDICSARSPKCKTCFFNDICKNSKELFNNQRK